ncbi:cysteine proteinase, partial [Glonium stellatum]
LLASLIGLYVVYRLLDFFGLPIYFWLSPLARMAWNSFVYLVPTRIAFALDGSGPADSSADPTNVKSKQEDTHAAKSEVLRKVFGLDKWGLLKSVQGDRSLRGLSMLLKTGSGDAPPGLGNWDNSCYQNSVIQGLASLPSLRFFLSRTTSNFTTLSMETTNGALFDTINKLNDPENYGQRLWTPGKLKSMSSFQQQDAQEYYSKILDELDKEILSASKQTRGPRTSGLLEAKVLINKTTSKIENPESKELTDAKKELTLPFSEPLQNPLDGLLAQRVGCIRCGYTDGLSMIPFNCLTVPLGKDWIYDIRDCLDEYTKLEPIEGVECAKCTLLRTKETLTGLIDRSSVAGSTMPEILRNNITSRLQAVEEALEDDDFADNTLIKKCQVLKKNWTASTKSRQAVIARSPKSLVIHVNRSVFDEFTGAQMKNYADVKFPKDLDLGPWCLGTRPSHTQELDEESPEEWSKDPTVSMLGPINEESPEPSIFQYKLCAVVTHYGRHENGHYVCYRKHPFTAPKADVPEQLEESSLKENGYTSSDEGWWRLSDEDVTRVSEEDVLRQGGVFMLFYERSE